MVRSILRLRGRHAVSTIIGGLIILSLILTALGTMVAVSQQYDQYQGTLKAMGRYKSQQFSENLVVNSPGLAMVTTPPSSGWASTCTTSYNCYNMSVSNLGGVAVQIVRVYINTTGGPTGSGCVYNLPNNPEQPCILNPSGTIGPYTFNQANQFVNAGEVNHAVLLALPLTLVLPDPNPAVPQNTIIIATSRGNVFTFQWPVPLQVYGQSQSAYSSGIMMVAYVGYNSGGYSSSNEPAFGGSKTTTYCHTETGVQVAGIHGVSGPGVGVSGNTLDFVNPWVTDQILESAASGAASNNSSDITSAYTQMYIFAIVINTGKMSYTPSAGSIDLAWYSANHLNGPLIGVYYQGTFYPTASAPSITPGTSYYAIYEITRHYTNNSPTSSVMFWGDASVTDGLGSNAEDQSYFSGTVLLSGLWIRTSC